MKCPYCKQDNNIVLRTDGDRRRRECGSCGKRFTTNEVISMKDKIKSGKLTTCSWCGRVIDGWGYYYEPDGKWFCNGGTKRDQNSMCLKNYLFEKNQADIKLGSIEREDDG